MKIIAFLASLFIQVVVATFGLFILLLALNGYSEHKATPAILVYIGLSLLISTGLGLSSALITKRLIARKQLGRFVAVLISVVVFGILGTILIVGNLFVSVAFAEVLRKMT